MGLKDYIGKAIGEAAGKFAIEMQTNLFTIAKGLVWKRWSVTENQYTYVAHKLKEIATPIHIGCDYIASTFRVSPRFALYVHNGKLVLCRTVGDKWFIEYQKGYNITQLWDMAFKVRCGVHSAVKVKGVGVSSDASDLVGLHLSCGEETRALEKDLTVWLKSEEIFKKVGLPHRRGWLLYGKPGNGKTTAIKHLAFKYQMNILIPAWDKGGLLIPPMGGDDGCKYFLLFEDFDLTFRGRETLNSEANFATFLNVIDGVHRLNNCVVVITTNDLSAIDSAVGRPKDETQWNSLSTRPGRIDRCVYFDNPNLEARLGIARTMVDEQEAAKLAAEGEGLSVAQFSAIVRERAMEILSHTVSEVEAEIGA